MGTVIEITTAIWRRVAALEVEFADYRPVVPKAPPTATNVIDLTAGIGRQIAALEMKVAECRRVVSETRRGSWRHKAYTTELIEAKRRLSILQGIRRDGRD
jgi:hypothetical protein